VFLIRILVLSALHLLDLSLHHLELKLDRPDLRME
jgi:hypothetical protein